MTGVRDMTGVEDMTETEGMTGVNIMNMTEMEDTMKEDKPCVFRKSVRTNRKYGTSNRAIQKQEILSLWSEPRMQLR
jgi:hypothetical protein